jgi:o-succinylbenzoate---CoA ligase
VVNELVAILLPPGEAFLTRLRRAWDDGDAVLPIDPATPRPHLERLLSSLAPAVVVRPDGSTSRRPDGRPVGPDDALVMATSGTTGEPKGAVHTHDGVRFAAYATSLAARVEPNSRWLACLPLSHVGGLSVVTRALVTGTPVELHPRFDPAEVHDARRRGATHTSVVPTALARMDPSGWSTILLGGSAIPSERPANTIATYGMTETLGGVVYDGLPLGGTEIRITDPTGGELPPGTPGSISVRTPALLRCYRDGSDPRDRNGWFPTADEGFIDPVERRLHVLGRSDDLIITGGEKVWPEPVERVLSAHPGITEVAVVGLPDAEWGQRVVACVVANDPAEPPSLEDLRALVRSRLPVAAAPKELRLFDSLPRTGIGKIRRSSLVVGDAAHD